MKGMHAIAKCLEDQWTPLLRSHTYLLTKGCRSPLNLTAWAKRGTPVQPYPRLPPLGASRLSFQCPSPASLAATSLCAQQFASQHLRTDDGTTLIRMLE